MNTCLAASWVGEAKGSLGGRAGAAELNRELRELYEALVEALRKGATDIHSEHMSEVRAHLTVVEESRTAGILAE